MGREDELRRIAELLDDAAAGSGRILCVSGEAGIGKSRLLAEAELMARSRGLAVASGRSLEADGAPAFWPWRQVTDALGDDGDLSWTADGEGTQPEERFQMFESIRLRITRKAASGGLLVLLDDLHWADPPSLRLLEHLVAAWPAVTALLVAHRPLAPGAHAPLRTTLGALARSELATRLELHGLGPAAAADHLAQVTGHQVGDTAVAELWRRTGGNPFYLAEFGRLLAGDSRTAPALDMARAVPDSVAGVIALRLGTVSSECRDVLEAAAIAGGQPAPTLVAAALELPAHEVLERFDEAVAAGLMVTGPHGEAPEFSHALVRDAIEVNLSSARRVRLHERMARALEAEATESDEALSQLAHHWLQVAPAGHGAHAAEIAARAADRAMRQLAFEEAARLFEAAAAVAPVGAERLLLGAAHAHFQSGDLERTAALCREVGDRARAAADAELLTEAALVMGGVGDQTISVFIGQLCKEALAMLADGDVIARSRLQAQLTVAKLYLGEYEQLDVLSREALEGAERSGDHETLVAALRARQIACTHPSGLHERLRVAARLLDVAQSAGDEVWARLWRFDALVQMGDLTGADAEVGALEQLAETLHRPLVRWHLANCKYALAMARGEFASARAAADESDAVAASAGQLAGMRSLMLRVFLGRLTGDDYHGCLDGLRATARGPASQMTWSLMTRMLLAQEALVRGRREEAAAIARELPPVSTWRLIPGITLVALSHRTLIACGLGDRAEARTLQRMFQPYADDFITSGAGTVAPFGSVAMYLGMLAATVGSHDSAVRYLERAVERNTAAGFRPWAIESEYQLALVLRQRGRPGDGVHALQLAIGCAQHASALGMRPLANRAADLRDELRSGTRRGRVLTPREEEIVRMVAEGLTSREIAGAMHISARTADNHVQHILDKLDLRSRTQIAAWAARHSS